MGKDKPGRSKATGETADLPLTDLVEKLRKDILAGHFGSSEPLRFRVLSERYGTSVSTLREALARLTGEKLVEFTPNSGFRVIQASLADLMDISRARLEIETAALRLSIEGGDEDWEAGIVAALHKLNRAQERLEREETVAHASDWELRHREFHMALVGGCGSNWLLDSCQTLRVLSDRYRYVVKAPTTAHPPLVAQHKPLADAAVSRRVGEACHLLREHILLSLEIVTGEKVLVFSPERSASTASLEKRAIVEPSGALGMQLAEPSPKNSRRRAHEDDSR